MVSVLNPTSAQQQAVVNPFQQRIDAQIRSTGKEDSQVKEKDDTSKTDVKQSVGTSTSSPSSVAKFAVSDRDGDSDRSSESRERGSLVDITV